VLHTSQTPSLRSCCLQRLLVHDQSAKNTPCVAANLKSGRECTQKRVQTEVNKELVGDAVAVSWRGWLSGACQLTPSHSAFAP
jgi:hypothetical protein